MDRVCKCIRKWKISSFWVGKHYTNIERVGASEILREISEIRFPRLQTISITGNNICSIEGISRLSVPALKEIHLSKNGLI